MRSSMFAAVLIMIQTTVPLRAQNTLFSPTAVHSLRLELSAQEWEKLQQVKGGIPFGGPPQPAPAPTPAGTAHKGGSFGMEFPWAKGSLTVGGKRIANVGLRYKGGGSYLASASGLRRNIKVELDRYAKDASLEGQTTLNLNTGAADPTRVRETLAYSLYRKAGIASPRTTLAELTLDVPAKHTNALVGMYTLVEQVDKAFLKDRFGNADGLLLKPEVSFTGPQAALGYYGEDWKAYEEHYDPRRKPTSKESQRIIEFARLIHKADDAVFNRDIAGFIDIDHTLKFIAVTAYLSHMDSILSSNHNAFIYLNPATQKFTFIPWDVDLTFAGFPLAGSPDQLIDLSIMRPYSGENRLVARLLANPDISKRYRTLFQELITTTLSKEAISKELSAVEAVTAPLLTREKAAAKARREGDAPFANMFGPIPGIREFVDRRLASVTAQLAGKKSGYVPPANPFGGPGGPPGGGPGGPPPGEFKIGNLMAGPMLAELDVNKDQKLSKAEWLAWPTRIHARSKKDASGRVNEKAIADAINSMVPAPPGGQAPPAGFGPGNFLAGPLMRQVDPKKSGWATLAQMNGSLGMLFDQVDAKRLGFLDRDAFAELLNKLFPPPDFGPPGARPPR